MKRLVRNKVCQIWLQLLFQCVRCISNRHLGVYKYLIVLGFGRCQMLRDSNQDLSQRTWSGQPYSLHRKWREFKFQFDFKCAKIHHQVNAVRRALVCQQLARFTSPQMRQRKNWRICGGDSLLHADAGFVYCGRLFNCSVVVFLANLLKNWHVLSVFWRLNGQIPASLSYYSGPPAFSSAIPDGPMACVLFDDRRNCCADCSFSLLGHRKDQPLERDLEWRRPIVARTKTNRENCK